MSAALLLEAFDRALATVRRLEREGLRTARGGPATHELERLAGELVARRAEVAAGAPFDRDWAGRTVRWVTEWLPDHELPLLARLGGIARAADDA